MNIEEIIDLQMLAFNTRDLKSMMSLYTEPIKIYSFPENTLAINGYKECEEMFRNLFEQSPDLNAGIIKTIFFDNKAIVHEYVSGRNGSPEKKEQVVIFEIKDQKISRMDLIKT
ncbi:hypothetical protein BC749_10547 [Flavobacterium araucananum]|uniref:SnoaL-like domain-containing protein n=1 Tax=Flavobacterium araucananum TaxID=946678 RepID=A0A227NYB7_9FLAO|nr:nuclear transport factor 2 family protein [Flavobacterium araucananum]OXG02283.1 hypothetical protein B0A64_18620 [Flavobacterium araucananum]PWJ98220.1 hypothetical protein BC749_10547 [Flavobacterium araucananum]